jgi:peptide/nickel transport system substrate-binding protein
MSKLPAHWFNKTACALAAVTVLLAGIYTMAGPDPQAPSGEGEVTAAFWVGNAIFDPTRYSAGNEAFYLVQLFEMPLRPYPNLERGNWLAESWELDLSGEKPVIDVTIRQNVKFHNGDILASQDFKFSYERLRDPSISPWSHLQAQVERFEIVNQHRFKLHFSRPDSAYISGNFHLWAVPKQYFESVGDEGFERAPIGTGPWRFISRKRGSEVRYERFPEYWNQDHRPDKNVERLTVKIIPEDATRLAALRRGEVDWIDGVPPVRVKDVESWPGIETASVPSGGEGFIQMPESDPSSPFSDVRVRRAVAHAVDMDAIIKYVLFGQAERYVQVGKDTLGYNPDLEPYEYDPDKARALLREAGYPDGFTTPCYTRNSPTSAKASGEAVFNYLGAVGIRCQPHGLEFAAWLNLIRRSTGRELDGLIMRGWGHGLPGDPTAAWMGHLHSYVPGEGWGSYSQTNDPKVDRMVKELRQLMDDRERAAMIRKIARYKHEQVLGGIPTYRPMFTMAWRADRIEFTPWPSPGSWRSFQEVKLKQAQVIVPGR